MNSLKIIPGLIEKLKDVDARKLKQKIFVGVDGYIDKIQKAVKLRTAGGVEFYPTLTEFSERIAAAAGKSGQVELVTQEVKIGGNAPIMSNALGYIGIATYCLGNAGFPDKNPVYNSLHERVSTLSIGNPAESAALEFNDGKMILSDLSVFRDLDWKKVSHVIDPAAMKAAMNECNVVALVGWCNPDHATDIWKGLLKDIMPGSPKKKLILFDLADPTKKSKSDLVEVLEVINSFSEYGKVVLALNENETIKLFNVLYSDNKNVSGDDLNEMGKVIFSHQHIDGLLIHPVDRSIYIDKKGTVELNGKLVSEPKISTGGGDNLNAGFCLGYLLDLGIEEAMLTGMATSGAYVSQGKSPDINGIIEYLKTW
jgi:hypothetical protein